MIVLDTSFLVGLYNLHDAHRQAAWATQPDFASGSWGDGVLLEYVFLETMSVLLQRAGLSHAVAIGNLLRNSKEILFVPCSKLCQKAWEGFAEQASTRLSLTDIAVAQFAIEHADGRVLSFDREMAKVPGVRLLPITI
ncbi:MAG TPA: PIN domain-containing protein [Terriglobales bacterium]